MEVRFASDNIPLSAGLRTVEIVHPRERSCSAICNRDFWPVPSCIQFPKMPICVSGFGAGRGGTDAFLNKPAIPTRSFISTGSRVELKLLLREVGRWLKCSLLRKGARTEIEHCACHFVITFAHSLIHS